MKERKTKIGKLLQGLSLGVIDGIPILSQIVTSMRTEEDGSKVVNVPRMVAGWATVLTMIAMGVFRYFGMIDQDLFMKVLSRVLGL